MATTSVNFIDKPVQPQLGWECTICLEDTISPDPKNPKRVITHDGPNGDKHWYHFDCINTWIIKNKTCPDCKVTVNSDLSIRTEKIINVLKRTLEGASLGTQSTPDILFGAATLAAVAGLLFVGIKGLHEGLAAAGWTLLPAPFLVGFYGLFKGTGLHDLDTISTLGHTFTSCGVLAATAQFYLRELLQDNVIFPVGGAIGLLHAAGKDSFMYGSGIGAVATAIVYTAIHVLGKKVGIAAAATIGGASGALANIKKVPYAITAIAAAAGYSAAKAATQTFEKYGQLPNALFSGVVGGIVASTASTLLDKGYTSLKERFKPSEEPGNLNRAPQQ